MDIQLGLALPIHDHPAKGSEPKDHEGSYKKWFNKKRCHGEAFGEHSSGKSQLLAWSSGPNEEDDPNARRGLGIVKELMTMIGSWGGHPSSPGGRSSCMDSVHRAEIFTRMSGRPNLRRSCGRQRRKRLS
ncbi:hypothetical protein EUGRSUZ_C01731 [Eucalyptus grandis]|uniref:Uncharacterized protein n=2 Tax=Eucalyptus grandis TaxID=71139 RepID=A0ACC3LEB2_EUCGR|nr:hypothetical protein EUGRSUZ_C01731 [Eucalyptus grandis]